MRTEVGPRFRGWQTGCMRVYVPATPADLRSLADQVPDGTSPRIDASARRVHLVTGRLREVLPGEDLEGLEYAAQLAAADASLELLDRHPEGPSLRVVLTVELPDAAVRVLDDDPYPSAGLVGPGTPAALVVCAHVDEPESAARVRDALAGGEEELERLDELDLLWYDGTELAHVPL